MRYISANPQILPGGSLKIVQTATSLPYIKSLDFPAVRFQTRYLTTLIQKQSICECVDVFPAATCINRVHYFGRNARTKFVYMCSLLQVDRHLLVYVDCLLFIFLFLPLKFLSMVHRRPAASCTVYVYEHSAETWDCILLHYWGVTQMEMIIKWVISKVYKPSKAICSVTLKFRQMGEAEKLPPKENKDIKRLCLIKSLYLTAYKHLFSFADYGRNPSKLTFVLVEYAITLIQHAKSETKCTISYDWKAVSILLFKNYLKFIRHILEAVHKCHWSLHEECQDCCENCQHNSPSGANNLTICVNPPKERGEFTISYNATTAIEKCYLKELRQSSSTPISDIVHVLPFSVYVPQNNDSINSTFSLECFYPPHNMNFIAGPVVSHGGKIIAEQIEEKKRWLCVSFYLYYFFFNRKTKKQSLCCTDCFALPNGRLRKLSLTVLIVAKWICFPISFNLWSY